MRRTQVLWEVYVTRFEDAPHRSLGPLQCQHVGQAQPPVLPPTRITATDHGNACFLDECDL